MSADDTMPDYITDLPEGHLACRACGIAVPGPHESVEVMTAYGPAEGEPPTQGALKAERHITLTTCPACAAIYEAAHDLLDTFPRVGAAIGSRSIAEHRVRLPLLATAALGQKVPRSMSEHHLRLLLAHVLPVCAGVLWSSRYVPQWGRWAGKKQAATAPWAHVREETHHALREAYAAWLQARIETPRAVPPPSGRACLICGVGAVTALPSRAHSIWQPRKFKRSSLGGPRGADQVAGHTCPTCTVAVQEAGAIGPTALERSFIAHKRLARKVHYPDPIDGLVAWAAAERDAANEEPWEHMDPDRVDIGVR